LGQPIHLIDRDKAAQPGHPHRQKQQHQPAQQQPLFVSIQPLHVGSHYSRPLLSHFPVQWLDIAGLALEKTVRSNYDYRTLVLCQPPYSKPRIAARPPSRSSCSSTASWPATSASPPPCANSPGCSARRCSPS